jgi:hypothetical protein
MMRNVDPVNDVGAVHTNRLYQIIPLFTRWLSAQGEAAYRICIRET